MKRVDRFRLTTGAIPCVTGLGAACWLFPTGETFAKVQLNVLS
jgi:hypothetical protein